MHILKRGLKLIHSIENACLVIALTAMILMAGADIIARNFFGGGVAWVPPAIRVMVLWLGLQGALLATRNNEHISIDVLSKVVKPSQQRWVSAFTASFSCVVCTLLAWFSSVFVLGTFEYADKAFSGLPAWPLQIIMPLAFSLMALRFLIHVIGFVINPNYQDLLTPPENNKEAL